MTMSTRNSVFTLLVWGVPLCLGLSCAQSGEEAPPVETTQSEIVRLLEGGQAVFGIFSGEHTPEQGAIMGQNRETDFVFYSLESGPFDIPQMQGFMQAMESGAGEAGSRPTALRIPPVGDQADSARARAQQGITAGVSTIVFPHVQTGEHAAVAVSAMGSDGWPSNPNGSLVNMLIVEDQPGIEHVRDIVSTDGVSVVFAGPGDLRRAYDRDM